MINWIVSRKNLVIVTLATLVTAQPTLNVDTHLQLRETSKQSIQIFYGEKSGYVWSVWTSPQGVAVDPCDYNRFDFVRMSNAERFEGDDKDRYSLTNPPYPPEETWSGAYPPHKKWNCVVKGNGQKGPPVLHCGNEVFDFQKDVQFNDAPIVCGNGYTYHRGWTVEY
ncbi:hypothetical protein PtrV1_05088 [Pyrenophora tritici-repentis]|uniref:Uncharacterized protein n=1 Tax=Pyrenophora tritici-repentis TaxID=45151 RepID=A0A5M9LJK8_9PLEO|nr:hypothetical protein PtrV1_05088 [Pyrenophora tritici-repentis]KAF7574026.1 hypothetical protein PtrM4_056490 [Pyrenophora tritici-repentis]KAI0569305.1 hypothetical protein Alg215_11719 [Pyrenophora tritici-repentis]